MSAPATDEIECTSLALQDMNKFSYFKYRIKILLNTSDLLCYVTEKSYLLNIHASSEWLR